MKNDKNEFSIKDIILIVKNWVNYLLLKWKILFLCILLGSLVGFIIAKFKKTSYKATTIFVLEEDKGGGGLGSIAGLATMAGLDVGGGGGIFQGENILELYKSRSMIEKTLFTPIDSSGQLIIDLYAEINHFKEKWRNDPKMVNFRFNKDKPSRLQDSLVSVFYEQIKQSNLNVQKPDKKLGIIKATVVSNNELFSKIFNDKIVENVNEFYVQTKTKKSLDYVNIVQQKTDSVRAVMRGALYNVASTQDVTPNLNPTRQVLRAGIQSSQFSAETNKAILEELLKTLELSKLSLKKETPLIQIVDKPILPLPKEFLSIPFAILLGGLLGLIISGFCLILRKLYKDILQD